MDTAKIFQNGKSQQGCWRAVFVAQCAGKYGQLIIDILTRLQL